MAKGKATPDSKGFTRNEVSSNRERRTGRDDGTGGGQPRTGHLGETSLARAGRAKGSDVDDVSGAGLRRNPDVEVTSVNGAEAGDKPGAVRKIGAKPVK